MSRKLRIRFFVHSVVSDWKQPHAHFLRGLARELVRMGQDVRIYEELGSWALRNLVNSEKDRSIEAIDQFRAAYPELKIYFYRDDSSFGQFVDEELKDVDVVVVHEWNKPAIVNQVLARKAQYGFKALFHDTHHRAYSNAGEILRFDMPLFDGVLAFAETIRRIYADGFGMEKTWTFHEGADVAVFRPMEEHRNTDLLWIGHWSEQCGELLEEFLLEPVMEQHLTAMVYGAEFPADVTTRMFEAGVAYGGYLPNLMAPQVYGQTSLALHVPGPGYSNGLAGVPEIRVFEALACGVPLISAIWKDGEGLFREGDYIVARDGREMRERTAELLKDRNARRQIGESGLATVRARHTCRHRAEQLMEILTEN